MAESADVEGHCGDCTEGRHGLASEQVSLPDVEPLAVTRVPVLLTLFFLLQWACISLPCLETVLCSPCAVRVHKSTGPGLPCWGVLGLRRQSGLVQGPKSFCCLFITELENLRT